jgi:hypothetical protein
MTDTAHDPDACDGYHASAEAARQCAIEQTTRRFGPREEAPTYIVTDVLDLDPAAMALGQSPADLRTHRVVILDALAAHVDPQANNGGKVVRINLGIDVDELIGVVSGLLAGGMSAILGPVPDPSTWRDGVLRPVETIEPGTRGYL